MSYVGCFSFLLCSSLTIALTTGVVIHKKKLKDAARSKDHIGCLAPIDGDRLGFQNELGGKMKDQLVALGKRVELKCVVYGAPQATIRWKHNGVTMEKDAPIGNHGVRIENTNVPIIGLGTTMSVLVIDCVDSETSGIYSCIADNGCTEPIETSAIITVKHNDKKKQKVCPVRSIFAGIAPKIVFWTDSLLERPEAAATLFCRAAGRPHPKIEWFVKDENEISHEVSNDDKHMLLSNGDLLVRGQSSKAENSKAATEYKCVATNNYGSASQKSIIIRAHT